MCLDRLLASKSGIYSTQRAEMSYFCLVAFIGAQVPGRATTGRNDTRELWVHHLILAMLPHSRSCQIAQFILLPTCSHLAGTHTYAVSLALPLILILGPCCILLSCLLSRPFIGHTDTSHRSSQANLIITHRVNARLSRIFPPSPDFPCSNG